MKLREFAEREDNLKRQLSDLVRENTPPEFIHRMHETLVEYAKCFERCDAFKYDMVSPTFSKATLPTLDHIGVVYS